MPPDSHDTEYTAFAGQPRPRYDVVVIGGGHNGLVCAGYLAQKGLSVAVFEARSVLGGMALCGPAPEEEAALPDCAQLMNGIPGHIVRDLKLKKHGLSFAKRNIPTIAIDEDGTALRFSKDLARTQASIRAVSKEDADAYGRFQSHLAQLVKLIEPLLVAAPPSLKLGMLSDDEEFVKLGEVMTLASSTWAQLRRFLTEPLSDTLDLTFEDNLLKGALAWEGVAGSAFGPDQIDAALTFLYRLGTEHLSGGLGRCYPRGGMTAFINALAAAALEGGVEIFAGRRVDRIHVDNCRARRIELADGDRVEAGAVVAAIDPHFAFFDLVGSDHLESEFIERLERMRVRGAAAKIDFTLLGLPSIRGVADEDFAGRIVISPSQFHLERAASALKYNQWSEAPGFEITFPSILDPAMAVNGELVMSVLMQYVPFEVEGGWEQRRGEFEAHMLRALSFYAPDLREVMTDYRLLLPHEIAQEWNNSGGHWHHAELAMDQVFSFRPAYGAAQYKTPIEGLYLSGAGTHPGGGLTGLPGYNAAQKLLADQARQG